MTQRPETKTDSVKDTTVESLTGSHRKPLYRQDANYSGVKVKNFNPWGRTSSTRQKSFPGPNPGGTGLDISHRRDSLFGRPGSPGDISVSSEHEVRARPRIVLSRGQMPGGEKTVLCPASPKAAPLRARESYWVPHFSCRVGAERA